MSTQAQIAIHRAITEAQGKYTYFLLAAAGATIALAVNQTQGLPLTWSQIPLGLAVSALGLSFFCGCRQLEYVSSILYTNAEILRAESGNHPKVGNNPSFIAAAREGMLHALEKNAETAVEFGHWQFRLLITGGVLYVAWHVWEMYLQGVG